jgi:murein DD-endopeptidase MepM/ murein hydrolase activator NlpD
MSRLQNPWPNGYTINKNSPYGYRIHPITGKRKFHQGVDVAGSFPVTVAADGKVMKVGWAPKGGGHTVLIDHGDIVTVYYHGAHKTALKVGQSVKAGDFIYTSGTTGASTGNHLHFEVRKPGGKWGQTLDPELFLPKAGQKPPEPISAPQPSSEPLTPAEPEKPSTGVLAPQPKPMSAKLSRFFQIRRALK